MTPISPIAFYNLHFLGLTDPSRFNAKLANSQYLVDKYRVVGFSELHNSSAVAEDSFFNHLRGVRTVYHCSPGFPGLALCVSRKLLSDLGIVDQAGLESHHKVFVPAAAHGFWYDCGLTRRLYLNIYLLAMRQGDGWSSLSRFGIPLSRFALHLHPRGLKL